MNAVLRLSLALTIVLDSIAACPAAAVPVVAHEMKLLRSKGRVWKHSDGWLARMIARDETVEAEFDLPEKTAPGKYYFFVTSRTFSTAKAHRWRPCSPPTIRTSGTANRSA